MKTKTVYVVQYYSNVLGRWEDSHMERFTSKRECENYISGRRKGGGIPFRMVEKPEEVIE